MSKQKIELPNLDEAVLEEMRRCGPSVYGCLERTQIALVGREDQFRSALAKIADMEALLRDSVNLNKELSGNLVLHDSAYMERAWLPKLQELMKRVDDLLAEGL